MLQVIQKSYHCLTRWEVYTSFLEAFSKKTSNSLAPQDTVNVVKWEIWCRVRKWVQRTRDFIAALFFSLSCIPTLCSCCTTEPCFDMTSRAWLDWVWRLLLSWDFILSVAFFQFWNGFMTQTPMCWWFSSLLWSVYKLCKKHHWCVQHTLASWTSFPSSLSIFSLSSKAESTPYKPSWKEAQQLQN